ncbi:redox-sensitive bicupin YhaK (pirin superfamily) [Labrenzia sp. EL_208]|uniref:pirin family protein n=1 Tax=Roseibium album TaxID=311410 RepID=UPI000CF0467B|nr:redox-sensitive bicupin YhaK (pirin superfamily) [Labrenzia sp. EL_142]MBG6174166.1 redox-sensitive bicupin YhaK (pirin superfamily) [Labrenzia sp. EL_132]MBG6228378.1 redox-sensitive bicupin YhaK (pirin superfamily) [Labrenzia sp. EL_208]
MNQLLRPSETRGEADFGWLKSKHSFSFGSYFDPNHIGFGALRVINEDRVAPSAGFPTHPHQNMEIISYIVSGGLEHKDSLGTGSVIRPGELQRMSAGSGVRHSEYNHSDTDPVHFLQIWIVPEADGLNPNYEQKAFPDAERRDTLKLIGSRNGREGSVVIHQDVDLWASLLSAEKSVSFDIKPGRKVWLQIVKGKLSVDGLSMAAGDGLGLLDAGKIDLVAQENSEFLLFDLAA